MKCKCSEPSQWYTESRHGQLTWGHIKWYLRHLLFFRLHHDVKKGDENYYKDDYLTVHKFLGGLVTFSISNSMNHDLEYAVRFFDTIEFEFSVDHETAQEDIAIRENIWIAHKDFESKYGKTVYNTPVDKDDQ
jgi:hypothetical protein